MKTEEQKIAENWEDVWKKLKFEKWDKVSEIIYQTLCEYTSSNKTGLMLEAGSGTGRISCKLKESGNGDVVLLDVSETAIQISRKVFEERNQTALFILGSIFKIPVKDNTFDLVWNAGVLEHFSESERSSALKEMTRVCKNDGLIVTLNPFSRAVFYRIGKWFAERSSRWIYGYEKPIKSMKKYEGNCIFITEYSVDFDTTIDFLSYLPLLNHFTFLLNKIFQKISTRISNNYGYLLVSVARKIK